VAQEPDPHVDQRRMRAVGAREGPTLTPSATNPFDIK
jgi:hypothetical protein